MSEILPKPSNDLEQHQIEVWLLEYRTCQDSISDHEARIWQSATVFVSISIAGLSLVTQRLGPSIGGLLVVFTSSVLSITILLLWYKLVNRWWSFQNVLWYRMQELDVKLGMRRNLYMLSMDKSPSWHLDQITDRSGFERLNNTLGKAHVATKAKTYLRRIVVLIVMAWMLLSITEIVLFVLKINIV